MSLQINTFNITFGTSKPRTVPRIFTVSPPIGGNSTWNLDTQGKINLGTYGTWTFTPNSNFTASVKMWGAGASGGSYSYLPAQGACGGASTGVISFQSGVPYVILVGQGGSLVFGAAGPATLGGGGYGRGAGLNPRGGGLTGIFSDSYTHANSVMIAGGGGSAQLSNNKPGGGGGTSGGDANSQGSGNGFGGTQTAGGNHNNGGSNNATSGTALAGGLGSTAASGGTSGGGGGYWGGGGGTYAAGGGSGYLKTDVVTGGTTVTGSRTSPGNAGDVDRGNAGLSGTYASPNGYDGRVVIS